MPLNRKLWTQIKRKKHLWGRTYRNANNSEFQEVEREYRQTTVGVLCFPSVRYVLPHGSMTRGSRPGGSLWPATPKLGCGHVYLRNKVLSILTASHFTFNPNMAQRDINMGKVPESSRHTPDQEEALQELQEDSHRHS